MCLNIIVKVIENIDFLFLYIAVKSSVIDPLVNRHLFLTHDVPCIMSKKKVVPQLLVLAFKNHRIYKYIGNKDLICIQRSPIFMCFGVLKCEQ